MWCKSPRLPYRAAAAAAGCWLLAAMVCWLPGGERGTQRCFFCLAAQVGQRELGYLRCSVRSGPGRAARIAWSLETARMLYVCSAASVQRPASSVPAAGAPAVANRSARAVFVQRLRLNEHAVRTAAAPIVWFSPPLPAAVPRPKRRRPQPGWRGDWRVAGLTDWGAPGMVSARWPRCFVPPRYIIHVWYLHSSPPLPRPVAGYIPCVRARSVAL